MMKRIFLSSLWIAIVAATTQFYKPVFTPAARIRLFGPLKVADRTECQIACDCAREQFANCNSFSPPIPQSNCQAYFYRDGGCALLGQSVESTCTVNNTEYVHITDPCADKICGTNGKCAVFESWIPYCQCYEGFQGVDCEETVDTTVSFKNRTCYLYEESTLDGELRPPTSFDKPSYQACYDYMKERARTQEIFLDVFSLYGSNCIPASSKQNMNLMQSEDQDCNWPCSGNRYDSCTRGNNAWLVYPEEIKEPDACVSSSCGENGLCLRKKGGFTCFCKYGFEGDTCSTATII